MPSGKPAVTCDAMAKSTGNRCKLAPAFGLKKCPIHGAGNRRSKDKANDNRVISHHKSSMLDPIPADDPEADPIEGTAIEYRRTIAWIRYATYMIEQLESDQDLVYGQSADEEKDGYEQGAPVKTFVKRFTSQINKWVEILHWNRKHADNIAARWLQYGLDARRLQLEEKLVDMLVDIIGFVVRGLGRDPADPEVRRVINSAFDMVEANAGAFKPAALTS